MIILLLSISAFALIATVLPIFNLRHWMVYAMRAQRFQLGILLFFLFALSLYYLPINPSLKIFVLSLLLLAALFNLAITFPFTPFAKKEVRDSNSATGNISLISANVRMSNDEAAGLLRQIEEKKPDLVLLLEMDEAWLDRVAILREDFPYQCLCPQENTYGMTLFSKFPLKSVEVQYLVDPEIPSIHCKVQISEDQQIQFIGLHPRPPAPWTKEENKDFELLIAAELTNQNGLPCLVAGDLNDVAWSPVTSQFKQISRMKDPRVGRGFYSTYNALIPIFRMPIDHFFVSEEFTVCEIERLEKYGSDHFPIYLQLNLEDK